MLIKLTQEKIITKKASNYDIVVLEWRSKIEKDNKIY